MLFPSGFPRNRPVGHEWFALGVNYPWIGPFSHDIGPNQIMSSNPFEPMATSFCAETLSRLQEDFARLKAWGIDVIRMWAFENGEGLLWRKQGTHWFVNGIDIQFLENVCSITAAAQAANIRIYWTLLRSQDFDLSRSDSFEGRRMSREFNFMIQNSSALDHFLQNAVDPLVRKLALTQNRGVFAIDLMNEPDMLWSWAPRNLAEVAARTSEAGRRAAIALRSRLLGQIAGADLLSYPIETRILRLITRMADFIKSVQSDVLGDENNLLISAGFGFINTIMRNRQLLDRYLDFFDFHFYDLLDVNNTSPVLPHWSRTDKPCIIGECGMGGFSGNPFEYNMIGDSRWQFPPNTTLRYLFSVQSILINYLLRNAMSNGFAGCLIWEYGRQYRRVFEMSRSLGERGECPRNRRNPWELQNCLMWEDRFPLLWKHDNAQIPECVHMRRNHPANELCGRPAVRSIRDFSDILVRQGICSNF